MATTVFSIQSISRGKGRSAIAAAAYRGGVTLVDERTGKRHSYARRQRGNEIDATRIVLPSGVTADWALDRQTLWNEAEFSERRKDSRVATEIMLALPCELSAEQRRDLAFSYAAMLADRYGVAVDCAVHTPSTKGHQRNHHAHLMLTTRVITPQGFGERSQLEWNEEKRKLKGVVHRSTEIRNLREDWTRFANQALERAGIEARLDPRSHADRGLELVPQRKLGPAATALKRRQIVTDSVSITAEDQAFNAQSIRDNPDQILAVLGDSQSVFTRQDVAMTLNRYVSDPDEFRNCFEAVMGSDQLMRLPERAKPLSVALPDGQKVEIPEKFTLKSTAELEWKMLQDALGLAASSFTAQRRSRGLAAATVAIAVSTLAARDGIELSPAQESALRSLTAGAALSTLVGVAGAGKSTLLKAARLAWEREGYRVFGAALAGKAAQGLRESSGISSKTIAALIQSWDKGTPRLTARDVLVVDEAGMIDSATMARLLAEARAADAKIVLVGDPEQLPAIGAGAPFRALIERVPTAQLLEVRRQREEWQRQATIDFSQGRTAEALARYIDHGCVRLEDDPVSRAVDLFLANTERPGTQAVLSHSNAQVRSLNEGIRAGLKASGRLDGAGAAVQTCNGPREFLVNDRIILLRNAVLPAAAGTGLLEIKNGQLGTIVKRDSDTLTVRADGIAEPVKIPLKNYTDLDHGYALTVHKTQGATLDRVWAIESSGMDRNLLYVALSRHRDDAVLLADRNAHADLDGLARSLARRHNVKETTLDYLGPHLAAAERAWIAGEADRRRPSELEALKKIYATADYEARHDVIGLSSAEIAALAATFRPPPLAQVLEADAALQELARRLDEARSRGASPTVLADLGRRRDQRERQLTSNYDREWRPNIARVAALMRHEEQALRHERTADAALPALRRWQVKPPPEFSARDWRLAHHTLARTRSAERTHRILCDVLTRRRPARSNLERDVQHVYEQALAYAPARPQAIAAAPATGKSDIITANGAPVPLSIDQVKAGVAAFCREYPQALDLSYKVRTTQEELYGVQAAYNKVGTIKGAYLPRRRQVDLPAASIRDEADLRSSLSHEVLGHFGLNTFEPGQKRAILDAIAATRSDAGFAEIWRQIDGHYKGVSESTKAEEIFCLQAEKATPAIDPALGIGALNEVCFARRRPLTPYDLDNIVAYVAYGMSRGERPQQTFPATDRDQFRAGDLDRAPVRSESQVQAALLKFMATPQIVRTLAGKDFWIKRWRHAQLARQADTFAPHEAVFAGRTFDNLGAAQPAILKDGLAFARAVTACGPHLAQRSTLATLAEAALRTTQEYAKGLATNEQLHKAIKDMQYAEVHLQPGAAAPWAAAVNAGLAFLTHVHTANLAIETERAKPSAPSHRAR